MSKQPHTPSQGDTAKKTTRKRLRPQYISALEIATFRKILGISQREAGYIFANSWDKAPNWAAWEAGTNGMPKDVAIKLREGVLELQKRTALAHVRVESGLEEAYKHTSTPQIVLVDYDFTPTSKNKGGGKRVPLDSYKTYFSRYLDWVILHAMNISLATRFLEVVLVLFDEDKFNDWCIANHIPAHERNSSLKIHHRWAQDFAKDQGWLVD
ncbi:hypothetical protein [Conchiformibius steedae]|uniref:hypothetical protein n=1 Tax=Conchiformibius steedae TaxID=153493 RepID=UPI0026EEBDD7|nr:hypothetical protein [Conchiformibius steedae]